MSSPAILLEVSKIWVRGIKGFPDVLSVGLIFEGEEIKALTMESTGICTILLEHRRVQFSADDVVAWELKAG